MFLCCFFSGGGFHGLDLVLFRAGKELGKGWNKAYLLPRNCLVLRLSVEAIDDGVGEVAVLDNWRGLELRTKDHVSCMCLL